MAPLSTIVGKTIKRVEGEATKIVIYFTDGTHITIEAIVSPSVEIGPVAIGFNIYQLVK